MKNILVFLLVSLGAGGCFPTSQDLYDATPRFTTTESSVLFFRNTRSVFYNFSERADASIEVFRPKTPTAAQDSPGYAWFIAYNRLQSKAMVFHEATDHLNQDPCLEIQWRWINPEGAREVVATLPCPSVHPEDNFQFLLRSYRQIEAGREPALRLKSGRSVPLFHTPENQRRFLRLVRDYLELVDII